MSEFTFLFRGSDPSAHSPEQMQKSMQKWLAWFKELGVTMSSVPMPPVKDIEAFLDYAQWVIEEIKPKVG